MKPADVAGLIGVGLMAGAYVAASAGRLDPVKAPSLLMNLTGASLVLASLTQDFNLSAFLMESIWALAALVGLARLWRTRR
jgi:hypothetical protein